MAKHASKMANRGDIAAKRSGGMGVGNGHWMSYKTWGATGSPRNMFRCSTLKLELNMSLATACFRAQNKAASGS